MTPGLKTNVRGVEVITLPLSSVEFQNKFKFTARLPLGFTLCAIITNCVGGSPCFLKKGLRSLDFVSVCLLSVCCFELVDQF